MNAYPDRCSPRASASGPKAAILCLYLSRDVADVPMLSKNSLSTLAQATLL
jgi:hypothetical protein